VRAELLSIGTELLLGQIVDTNSAYLAGRLANQGIDLLYMSTVGDNLARATETVRRAAERSDLVVCTGGLGPTEDDLTREAIAAALGETPAVDPVLEAALEAWFSLVGGEDAARAGEPPRSYSRLDLRPRHERRHHLLESRCRAALWMAEQGGHRQGFARAAANSFPGAS
jgi:molybdenum cofactor synthesis domain-containing protein